MTSELVVEQQTHKFWFWSIPSSSGQFRWRTNSWRWYWEIPDIFPFCRGQRTAQEQPFPWDCGVLCLRAISGQECRATQNNKRWSKTHLSSWMCKRNKYQHLPNSKGLGSLPTPAMSYNAIALQCSWLLCQNQASILPPQENSPLWMLCRKLKISEHGFSLPYSGQCQMCQAKSEVLSYSCY